MLFDEYNLIWPLKQSQKENGKNQNPEKFKLSLRKNKTDLI